MTDFEQMAMEQAIRPTHFKGLQRSVASKTISLEQPYGDMFNEYGQRCVVTSNWEVDEDTWDKLTWKRVGNVCASAPIGVPFRPPRNIAAPDSGDQETAEKYYRRALGMCEDCGNSAGSISCMRRRCMCHHMKFIPSLGYYVLAEQCKWSHEEQSFILRAD